MPLNSKKTISIILEQCNGIEERCPGYRKEIIGVIADILAYERGHLISHTNIQKKINDKFNATARFLATQRGHDSAKQELDS